ncbi:MAG: class I mannose-6-phosphate isomerase [Pirellulales bacterium]|nr:class I mannose-6-phosphate isomerase [Pirellulales bacterium]
MTKLPLLRFRPLLKRYVWGGRRLAELGKDLGEGTDYAESWEVADHGQDQSVVAEGPLAGMTLGQLVADHGLALLGRHHPQTNFPLLFKFLDAQRALSVQVHPNDEQASHQTPPDLGKTEAWVIVDCEPGAKLYAGLKRGFDKAALEREIKRGTCELCLHEIPVQPGDCVFLPAGTVHAIGEGILIAEIQQSSDTTFRLYDWNRVGTDGQPRQLHVTEALGVIDFERGPVSPQTPRPVAREGWEQLVACDKFVLERGQLHGKSVRGGDDRMHILAVLSGQATVSPTEAAELPSAEAQTLTTGSTLLVPACTGEIAILPTASCTMLDIFLP